MEEVTGIRILFITQVVIKDLNLSGVYTELFKYFTKKGHHITIITPLERRESKGIQNEVINKDSHKIIRVKMPNINKANYFEKIISTFSFDFLVKRAIKKYLKEYKFDLVIYSTPPITLTKSISFVKEKFDCFSYLLLKDIFPQNAIDLGLLGENSLLSKWFFKIEKRLYSLSDRIGCMSQANVAYLLKKNKAIDPQKVEICPNSIVAGSNNISSVTINKIKREYDIPINSRVFIYGGNIGKPQGINFLIQVMTRFKNDSNVYFIVIGNGTAFHELEEWMQQNQTINVLLKNRLPKKEYDRIVSVSDVGIILLDINFTIPNYPFRLLGYLNQALPILAFVDRATDVGINAEKRGYGKFCSSNDLEKACSLIEYYTKLSKSELQHMGVIGFDYLKSNYSVENSYEIIMNSYSKLRINNQPQLQ